MLIKCIGEGLLCIVGHIISISFPAFFSYNIIIIALDAQEIADYFVTIVGHILVPFLSFSFLSLMFDTYMSMYINY